MRLDQALLAFIGDDVDVVADELHGLGVTKSHQGNAPQDLAVQRQLDQFGVLIGHGKQAFAHRVIGECRDIVIEPSMTWASSVTRSIGEAEWNAHRRDDAMPAN